MRRKNKPAVVVRNLLVTAYAAEGKSLARHEGKVIFIEKTVPGDEVDVLVTKSKADWAEGHAIHFHKLSADRVVPFCEHFGVCGGCQWQMLPYGQQLAYKQQQVYDQLTRIGGVEPHTMLPIVGCAAQTGYRNKLEFTFANKRYLLQHEVKDESITGRGAYAGFHARGVFDKVVNINTCHLVHEPVNQIREVLKQKAIEMGLSFCDIRAHTGTMKGVQYRICSTGHLMVNVILGDDDAASRKMLLDHLLQQVPAITTLYYTINQKQNDSMYGLVAQLVHGPPHATEVLGDFKFLVGPKSFFQTNTAQAEQLYTIARSMAELDGSQTLYDLYCGTGSIGIFCSSQAKKIIGVELIEEAIADAKANATLNGLEHTAFFAGDVVNLCTDDFFAKHGRPDVIITDPPRAGMHEKLIQKLLEIAAPIIVYVSCNPATQARDLKALSQKYLATLSQPVDMFPHTHHIENVVQLKLRPPE